MKEILLVMAVSFAVTGPLVLVVTSRVGEVLAAVSDLLTITLGV